jgi:hypothetical protein
MIKNSWIYALIVGLITTPVIVIVWIPTAGSHKALELLPALTFFFSMAITFSIIVLKVRYNSYANAFYSGMKASLITSLLATPSVITTILLKDELTLKIVPPITILMMFLMFFLFFTLVSSLIPFITKKHWGKMDDPIIDENILDS